MITRRSFLSAAAAGAAFLATRNVWASDLYKVERDELGVTLWLGLDHAPYPAQNGGYRDPTVIAFVPRHFRVPRSKLVDCVVHFHGHSTTAEKSMRSHQLREQLYESKQNAILFMPQGPTNSSDSSIGKLETPGGFSRMVSDALRVMQRREVRTVTGASSVPEEARIGTVNVSAHSGGYHAAACVIRHGGIDVNEVYLFDALYNETEVFRDWVLARKGQGLRTRHKLVSYYSGGTTAYLSRSLLAQLQKAGARCEHELVEGTLSREQIGRAEAVFIQTALGHHNVTHEVNQLRDCLYASSLERRLETDWFSAKRDPRPLERRR